MKHQGNSFKQTAAPLTVAANAKEGYRFGWFDWFCLWYPPGWLILFNRHWQHYHPDPEGWNWLEYGLFLIPGGFYLALLMRWIRLGCRAPQATPATVDHVYQTAFRREILIPILTRYFRAELHQAELLPRTGPMLVAMNHAGMCFPWDMVGLAALLGETRGWFVRLLAHEIFFDHSWLKWWLPVGWLDTLGGVRANLTSFEASMQEASIMQETSMQETSMLTSKPDTVLLYAPEGWHGLVKGWQQRYQLATFDPSFIRLSDRYQVPILPVVCIGNEFLHPWTINVKRLARQVGLPMFPISLFLLVFLLFPSMGVWANRTRLRYSIQSLETPWTGPTLQPGQLQDRTIAYRTAQALRSRLQAVIDQLHLN